MQVSLSKALKRLIRRRRDLSALESWTEKDEGRRIFYAQFVTSDDIVFDVGANVGNRAKIFGRLAKHVVLFEPQPYCLDVLVTALKTDEKFSIVPKALGRAVATERIMVSDAHTVSSMSKSWIEAVKASGRFSHISWNGTIEVETTTLDASISQFGEPSFIKIDVEGYEAEVLAGLSRPVSALSLEFTPEHMGTMQHCLVKLEQLGNYEYNLSLGESMQMEIDSWVNKSQIVSRLAAFDEMTFGDVYARRIAD